MSLVAALIFFRSLCLFAHYVKSLRIFFFYVVQFSSVCYAASSWSSRAIWATNCYWKTKKWKQTFLPSSHSHVQFLLHIVTSKFRFLLYTDVRVRTVYHGYFFFQLCERELLHGLCRLNLEERWFRPNKLAKLAELNLAPALPVDTST